MWQEGPLVVIVGGAIRCEDGRWWGAGRAGWHSHMQRRVVSLLTHVPSTADIIRI